MAILSDLVGRAFAHPQTAAFVKRTVSGENGSDEKIVLPVWGIALLYVTFAASAVGVTLFSYMLQEVITTLCMVESPMAAITVSPSTREDGFKDEKDGLLETGPTITLVSQKPITSSIRGTIRHLVATAGRHSRFRGFRIYAMYGLIASVVTTFFGGALPFFVGREILVAGISGALIANFHAAWTHKVVSMPTDKSFWQLVPGKNHWRTLALPAAIHAAMPYISVYLVAGFGMMLGLHKLTPERMNDYNCAQWTSVIIRVIATGIFGVACTLFLCLPAIVTHIRIEASILPEDQDTIVPFDRTFGGKLVSQLVGGTGIVSFLDAWRSFNWEARRRLIKLYIKTFIMVSGLVFLVAHVLLFEAFAIFGSQLPKIMAQIQHETGRY